ncbi:unnamed protein product [Cuscuta europaea]|uniref:Protein FATTY ACID EXPORT 1, chloroplastic n=1 Tax=Cuscuta europaea TaxID=41803 RepID=A0A9P1DXY2_CUSEU|nr:unnamed protein product [Cuscuta europaea]
MSSSAISKLCYHSSLSLRPQLHPQFFPPPSPRLPRNKVLICMSNDGRGADSSSVDDRATLSYNRSENSLSAKEKAVTGNTLSERLQETNELVGENHSSQPKRAAKIHDFCFGIPFGGFVLCGGLLGFAFSRNIVNLGNGVLYGGALLALSSISLKVWRQGKSSLPFILGQAVLAGSLLQKNMLSYSLTKKIFPTGFYAILSAAMLCFYVYVVISGGNPPPKKSKTNAAVATS